VGEQGLEGDGRGDAACLAKYVCGAPRMTAHGEPLVERKWAGALNALGELNPPTPSAASQSTSCRPSAAASEMA
jgi:hypothetical protein